MDENRDRSDGEDGRENNAAAAINPLGPCRLLIVVQDGCHQDLNQAKENK
jgi:hypothetical protein